MLNAVSSGSRLAKVTPVRSGGSSSKSRGSLARPQLASVTPAEKRKVRHGRSIGGSLRALSYRQTRRPHAAECRVIVPRSAPRPPVLTRPAGPTDAPGQVAAFRIPRSHLPLPRRPDPDRLAATGSEHEMQPRRRVHRSPRDGDGQRVPEPVRARAICVDLRDVLPPGGEE